MFSWIPLLAGAVAVGGAGVGLGWLLWAGSDSAASGTGLADAAADAAGACQVFQLVPSLSKIMNAGSDRTCQAYDDRLNAAAALSHSAAQLDHRYDALDKALADITQRLQTNSVRGAGAVAAHKKVLALCAKSSWNS